MVSSASSPSLVVLPIHWWFVALGLEEIAVPSMVSGVGLATRSFWCLDGFCSVVSVFRPFSLVFVVRLRFAACVLLCGWAAVARAVVVGYVGDVAFRIFLGSWVSFVHASSWGSILPADGSAPFEPGREGRGPLWRQDRWLGDLVLTLLE